MSELPVIDAPLQPDTRSELLQNPPSRKRRRTGQDTTTHIGDTEEGQSNTSYIRGLDTYERVEKVIQDLRNQHRWSLKDFLHFYVTAESDKSYAQSRKVRIKRLAEALNQKIVLDTLFDRSSALYESALPLVSDKLRTEVKALCDPAIGLGEFNSNTPVRDLNIQAFSKRLRTAAPGLHRHLLDLIKGPGSVQASDQASDQASARYDDAIFMICSLIAFQSAPRNANQFPTALGIYIHALGGKRRVMSVLAGLGLIPSYKTIMRRKAELADIGQVISLFCTNNLSQE
jgi:hypothetical protein